ncbi:methyltransferase [Streptomyces flavofungini]|uniref:methyltransferase n=1 Tax=Streptomyces flavofungini TaxID=68200 RepID=UPI0034DF332B
MKRPPEDEPNRQPQIGTASRVGTGPVGARMAAVPYDETTMCATAEGTFALMGMTWDILPGVFLPALTYGTAFFSQNLPYPRGGRFLEMGCGAGVTAVCAGQAGCEDVLAVDVDPQAVATTMRNAARHDVFRVRGKAGDVFAALDAQDGPFDLIFWALPYENVPAGSPAASAETRCVLDVGHYCCLTYLAGARCHLAPGGRLFLGLGDISDENALQALAAEHGYHARLAAADRGAPGQDIDDEVEHRLYELLALIPPTR